jgi:hypothetical protein
MNASPPCEHIFLPFADDAHHPPQVARTETSIFHQLRLAAFAGKIDLGSAVTHDMHVRRRVIVLEDDKAEPRFAVDSHHAFI